MAGKGKASPKGSKGGKKDTGKSGAKDPETTAAAASPGGDEPKIEKEEDNEATKKSSPKGKGKGKGDEKKAAKAGAAKKDDKSKKGVPDKAAQKIEMTKKVPKDVVAEKPLASAAAALDGDDVGEGGLTDASIGLLEKEEYLWGEGAFGEGEEEEQQQHAGEIRESSLVIEEYDEEGEEEGLETKTGDDISSGSFEDLFADVISHTEEEKVYKKEVDFFEKLGHLPEVDMVSVDSSISRFIQKLEGQIVYDDDEDADEGSEEQEIEVSEAPPPELIEEKEEESKIPIEAIFSSEISLDEFESSSEEEGGGAGAGQLAKQESDSNLFQRLMEVEAKPIVVETIDFELLARQAEERELRQDTAAFLTALIQLVVDRAEYRDPKIILRANLDKVQLFHALIEKVAERSVESKVNKFIKRKTVDYHRRQKVFRAIKPDAVETINEDFAKYQKALDELNEYMGRELKTAEVVREAQEKAEASLKQAEEEHEDGLTALNTLIRKTFSKRGSDRLNMFVDKRIREMNRLRQDISDTRAVFIGRQHTAARLQEKMNALEYIGPGLQLHHYEALQNEAYALVKKLEERNLDLERFRIRFINYTNTLAHVREKEQLSHHVIESKLTDLNALLAEKRRLQALIYNFKTSHVRGKKEIRVMSDRCGLIDKPALLIDFDETLEKCLELRAIVEKLRANVVQLNKKILAST